jgi:hypothetical protein
MELGPNRLPDGHRGEKQDGKHECDDDEPIARARDLIGPRHRFFRGLDHRDNCRAFLFVGPFLSSVIGPAKIRFEVMMIGDSASSWFFVVAGANRQINR